MAKWARRLNAHLKRRWHREVLKHRWRALKLMLPRWRKQLYPPRNIRALIFGLRIPPSERIAQLKAYAERLRQPPVRHE